MSTPFASPAAQPASASLPVFPRPSAADFDAPAACMPLAQFGVIDVAGDDAATFLHGQLTNDIEHLDAASARVAGYCSPKGRLLASFLAWREGHGVRLLVSKDVQAAVQKRLSMFVLRAKAKLSDASDAVAVVGFSGDVRDALSGVFDALPDGVHVKVDGPAGVLIRVPDAAGRKRYLWIGPRAEVDARIAALAGTLPVVSPAVWDWLDVRAGEPRITQPVVEQFVPQMVNFDVIGAVNFRKGCYPGQEVVARSQYRGTIKRRTALAHVAGETDSVHAGVELFHSDDPGQPCGMIVNAAAAPAGGVDALVEIKLAALDSGSVHVGAADGPALAFDTLPYAWPTDA
ncbi:MULTISPECIES: YgfZ/GcvT domain-containing protein [Burkholderia]|uniref:Glycine cleavage T protein (Aminomethyl transferase) n=3 Tax=Burkholderia vietnamiensis TaxID=60552 RepID=A4JEX0_BURVG|nr:MULTISPECIES: folate-binding protein YgfZ [Burkholderia]ABO54823.1 glycine cleavage T protein (aminomethyl transferase) [Burkholderia vietnamiensis G4]AFJ86048.1 Folate-dependent protein for Fe/S cluster synthesis/repair in oxidative stress [Burkholderia sp. KJ006]AOK00486.1 folate-binding protein [Burkholderia vietnamiensis]AOK41165.1 folate-binding protein [Burkholderia vietnamiensis]KKI37419.1 folate-binding protein [Burkholderia vietnamiensis]